MKRLITLLIAGLSSATMAMAQEPVNVVGNMRIADGATMVSKGEMRIGISTANGHITNEGTLKLPKGITFVSDDVTDGTLLNNGTVDFTGASQSEVKVIKSFGSSALFYTVSFPFDVKVSEIVGDGGLYELEVDYYLGYYDSQSRANDGFIGTQDRNWKWIVPADVDYVLEKNKAYMVYTNSPMRLVFPAHTSTSLASIYASKDKTVPLTYYKPIDSPAPPSQWGWNFIGNLNTTNFLMGSDHLKDGSDDYYETSIYKLGLDGQWTFIDPVDNNTTMAPYAGAFTQTPFETNLTFLSTGRHQSAAYQFRSEEAKPFYSNYLKLSLANENDSQFSDWLQVIVEDRYEKEFEIGKDAVKMFSFSKTIPDFYTMTIDETSLVSHKTDFSENEISLGLNVKEDGNYSIELEKLTGFEDRNILLVDKKENKVVDLSTGFYSFYAQIGNDKDRFALRFTTDFTSIDTPASSIVVYTENSDVIIDNISIGDNIEIYNVSGVLLKNGVATSEKVSYTLPEKGVYIVNVNGATSFAVKVMLK